MEESAAHASIATALRYAPISDDEKGAASAGVSGFACMAAADKRACHAGPIRVFMAALVPIAVIAAVGGADTVSGKASVSRVVARPAASTAD